jgi:hypothetical protein
MEERSLEDLVELNEYDIQDQLPESSNGWLVALLMIIGLVILIGVFIWLLGLSSPLISDLVPGDVAVPSATAEPSSQ